MHILITGGAGYIGSHIVKQILENDYNDVTIIDNLSTGSERTLSALLEIARESGKGSLRFYHADLSDFVAIEKIFLTESFDAVLHFAASIVVPESVQNPLKYYMNNTVNTTNLIRLCEKYGVNKFIFSSTAAVYGEPKEIPVKETSLTHPLNPYGMSKLMSEQILRDTAKVNPDFKFVILRYFNVAGADISNRIGQCFPNATHLIKVAAQCVLGIRDKLLIFGNNYDTPDGTCIRDYIHVDDLASAHLKALEYLFNTDENNVFNCGYGHGFSVQDVVKTLKDISGSNFVVETSPRRAGDPALLISDNTKIKNILGWEPQYDDLALICKTALAWEQNLLMNSSIQ